MKAMKCEMCGSNDIIKQDGFYICQACGTKYTVEEAKKLLVEGTVEVKRTKELDSIIDLAKEAYEDKNFFEIESDSGAKQILKFCEEGLKLDSNCKELLEIKANVYIIKYEAKKAINILKKLFKDEEYDDKLIQYILNFRQDFREGLESLCYDDGVYDGFFSSDYDMLNINSPELACNIYREIIKKKMDFVAFCLNNDNLNVSIFEIDSNDNTISDSIKDDIRTIKNIEKKILNYDSSYKIVDDEIIVYENIINSSLSIINDMKNDICTGMPGYISRYKEEMQSIDNAVAILKRLKNTDRLPIENKINQLKNEIGTPKEKKQTSSVGCYVATCVYGSYDCPEVWTLRRYRDYTLAETWYGRAFIKMYYAISPTIVKRFGNTDWFKKLWRGKLDRMVDKLNNQGFDNTPYNDRNW